VDLSDSDVHGAASAISSSAEKIAGAAATIAAAMTKHEAFLDGWLARFQRSVEGLGAVSSAPRESAPAGQNTELHDEPGDAEYRERTRERLTRTLHRED
jgi:hypothetical protein